MTAGIRMRGLLGVLPLALLAAHNGQAEEAIKQLDPVVVSANRGELRRFDAPAAVDAVTVDPFRAASPLVNLSELSGPVPGVIVKDRQNFAQDLQLSVRGFGTRSTFGVRGVRILIDGIPATMPDGQGQLSSASLSSAKRIEFLRGPLAQLYGNAAGGVVQVFTEDPPFAPDAPFARLSVGAGSYGQWQAGATVAGGSQTLAGLLDVSRYSTDGYRDHSAAERTQVNAKVVAKASSDTTITGIVNSFRQPETQDPLGLTRAAFEENPRQAIANTSLFDTAKTAEQLQAGLVLDHRLSSSDTLNGRVYGGTRQINQRLAFAGSAPTSSGGVIDLDRDYGGVGLSWTHKTKVNKLPLRWILGMEADRMREHRRGFVNNNGTSGDLHRDEDDEARNVDLFGQVEWMFSPQWEAIAGVRTSTVKFSVDDHYVTAASPDDSGSVRYRHTSPVAGIVWHATDEINFYANLGKGFETPTLAESAYRSGGTGPNFTLDASTSTQAEVGMKVRREHYSLELAVFDARSRDEIVLQSNTGGRSVYQNADRVRRRGIELGWQGNWKAIRSQLAYTLLDARFRSGFSNGADTVASGNRLPGTPMHTLFTDLEYRLSPPAAIGLEMRAQSKSYVDDVNSDAAEGYAVFSARSSYEFRLRNVAMVLFGRIDNLFDRRYAGSVIVNESNGRFFEPAAGRSVFVGVRTLF